MPPTLRDELERVLRDPEGYLKEREQARERNNAMPKEETIKSVDDRILHPVRAALAELIGDEEADLLSPQDRAMRLASLAPTRYLSIHRAGQAALRAERECPPTRAATPEERAAAAKLERDIALAKVDYPRYKEQRDRETAERIKANKEHEDHLRRLRAERSQA
jgi:hypothetical protein